MSTVRVAVAGSSGSIGTQTLDVVRTDRERFEVVGLSVGSSVDMVVAQAREFLPSVVAVADPDARREVAAALADLRTIEVVSDDSHICGVADVVINGIVGFAGLPVTMATLAAGRRLGLANKESLIAAGPVVRPVRTTPGAELIPVDSEHCALHQCLRSSLRPDVELKRLVLTASGGPFRGRSAADLAQVTVQDALAHPTWAMGPKITVDSSTLMNKGLEVIEAHELFDVPVNAIEVVVHPQSVVHSMVEFTDGSTIAQLSMPDMRLPIGYAMGWPNRIDAAFGTIDWTTLSRLDFEPPDRETFPCLDLAYEAGRTGGTAPAMLSAANEVAVDAFLAGRIRWNQIPNLVVSVLDDVDVLEPTVLDEVIEADRRAREVAMSHLDAMI
ncbi:MAG: 1-deoxy-D-xylulose-5-phosphate reductoisomerase [Actinomycetota bacterium]|nr:1-deoxy-D-xylulose-5-phosphate reductoisomerase [Actinomycetota bacterium]MDA3013991.1 1-deoxy-D-xylulose-5-phosphate reductoisomerase [Actinomycetota bacterium]MDA3028087.1 1-deoxy-D-xylulose-5-phosphate reductoisomerase [Actinomycetota bacterium]